MNAPLHKKRPILVRMIKSLSVIGTVTLIISVLNELLQAVQLGDNWITIPLLCKVHYRPLNVDR